MYFWHIRQNISAPTCRGVNTENVQGVFCWWKQLQRRFHVWEICFWALSRENSWRPNLAWWKWNSDVSHKQDSPFVFTDQRHIILCGTTYLCFICVGESVGCWFSEEWFWRNLSPERGELLLLLRMTVVWTHRSRLLCCASSGRALQSSSEANDCRIAAYLCPAFEHKVFCGVIIFCSGLCDYARRRLENCLKSVFGTRSGWVCCCQGKCMTSLHVCWKSGEKKVNWISDTFILSLALSAKFKVVADKHFICKVHTARKVFGSFIERVDGVGGTAA